MSSYLWTSESVSPGHPDKIADQISDTVLDAKVLACIVGIGYDDDKLGYNGARRSSSTRHTSACEYVSPFVRI